MTAEHEKVGRRSEVTITAVILVAHLCVTVPLAMILSIWIDEAYSLNASMGDLSFVLQQSREVEMQPPFYFVLLWAWRLIHPSIGFARMLSVVIAVCALVATHAAARRWIRGISPAWTVGPLAFNTYTLYAATEIRPYALVLLWAALLLVFFYDGYLAEKPRRSARWFHAAVSLAALLTYYYLGFLLAAGAVALIVGRRWRNLRDYVLWMAFVGLLFLKPFIDTSSHIESSRIETLPGLLRSVEFVVASFASFPFALYSFESVVRWSALAVIIGTTAVAIWMQRRRTTPEARALWAFTGTVGLFYILVVMVVMGEEIRPRHMLAALLPTIFSIVSAAAGAGQYRRIFLTAWAIAAIGFTGVASVKQFSPLAKGGDFKRVAKYIEANEKPGQSIAIVVANAENPLSYYYRGTSELVGVPRRDALTQFEPKLWRLDSEEEVRAKLASLLSDEGEAWIFTDFVPGKEFRPMGMDMNFRFLEAVLASDYEIVSRKDFYAASVRFVRKRTTATDVPGV